MAFSEHGILMLSSVLRSETAVNVGFQIINAFVEMRRFLKDNFEVFLRLENVERKQSMLQNDSDIEKYGNVFLEQVGGFVSELAYTAQKT